MDGAFDIPDSTDWINTPLKDLSTLENALHCQICKEFYDTPMLTSCSHTFCSKCIRTSLSTDGKCPACRTADQASKLRNNWALQEVVATFLAARPAALEVAREAQEAAAESTKPGKRKRIVLESDDVAQAEQDGRATRSKSRRLAASQTSEAYIIEIEDSDGDGDFEPEMVPDDGLVECPLGCGKRMKIEAVEPHLDRCEDERRQASRLKSRTPVNVFGSSRPNSAQNAKPQERISELSYSLLTETKLKKKLEELGIPNWGPKPLLIRRHTEWVNIWNANCDSNHPRSKRELLHELDIWERTQGGRAPGVNTLASNVMRKDFDGAGWASRNRDDFSKLIAEAKRKKNNPAPEEDRPKSVDVGESANVVTPDDFKGLNGSPLVNGHSDLQKPYENNMEAINPVQEKVDAANAGENIGPVTNGGFEIATDSILAPETSFPNQETTAEPVRHADNPALLEQNHFGSQRDSRLDEHLDGKTGLPCDLPAHFQSSPVKKVPMFAVPQEPVTDVDGGGGGGGATGQ